MKTLRIKKVSYNNKTKSFYTLMENGQEFHYPYSRLDTAPSADNPIIDIQIDKECASHAFEFTLQDGIKGGALSDEILYYHRDPEYMHDLRLYEMSSMAKEIFKNKNITKSELTRRMKCSMMQLNRLLDQTFYGKTTDQMIKLLTALDYRVIINYEKVS